MTIDVGNGALNFAPQCMQEEQLEKREAGSAWLDGGLPWYKQAGIFAADKMTPAQAEYQDRPNGIYSCGMCSLFEAPNACKVVEGEISKDGWCKVFALQD